MNNSGRDQEGYQPVKYGKNGFHPIKNTTERGYQPSTKSSKNVVPPNTTSHVKSQKKDNE